MLATAQYSLPLALDVAENHTHTVMRYAGCRDFDTIGEVAYTHDRHQRRMIPLRGLDTVLEHIVVIPRRPEHVAPILVRSVPPHPQPTGRLLNTLATSPWNETQSTQGGVMPRPADIHLQMQPHLFIDTRIYL